MEISQDFGQKAQMRGMNSFIADAEWGVPHGFVFVADQPVAPQLENALLMDDIFSKYTQVVGCRSKRIPVNLKQSLVIM